MKASSTIDGSKSPSTDSYAFLLILPTSLLAQGNGCHILSGQHQLQQPRPWQIVWDGVQLCWVTKPQVSRLLNMLASYQQLITNIDLQVSEFVHKVQQQHPCRRIDNYAATMQDPWSL